MPRGSTAPKDCPAEPRRVTSMVPSGRPSAPYRLVSSWPSIVPTVRLTLRTGRSIRTCSPRSRAGAARRMSSLSSALSSPWSWARAWCRAEPGRGSTGASSGARSSPEAFQWSTASAGVEQVDAADGLVDRAQAQGGEELAHLLGDELEEGHDVLGLAGEPLAQLGVLGGHAHRAGVQVAHAHHDAALDHQRGGGEAELLGAEQRRDDDVAAGLHLPVGLDDHAVAQVVEHEGLLGLGQADLPRGAGVLERGQRRRARAAVVPGDQDDVGVRLGDAGGHRAHADLADQLGVDPRRRVGVLEVVDELGEVLDGVDVVVRRRGDQPDARAWSAGWGHPGVDLVRGQLAALAGLGALGDLDLDVVGVGEVVRRHPEAAGGDLLDGRAAARVVQPVGVLPALAGVRLPAEHVHGDGEGLVGLGGDGAVAHRAGGEPLDDRADRLDLLHRDRGARRRS